jgi:hypothetical protein
MECQAEIGSRQTLLFRLFVGSRRAFDTSRLGLDFSGLCDFLFLSCLNKFFVRLTRYFLGCSTTSGWRFQLLGTSLISGARRASAKVNGEKLTELNDG